MCKAGCADKRKQRSTDTQMAVGQRIGWVQACEGGRWGRGQAASCLHAGWLPAPEQLWPSLPCWQGAGRRPGKGAGCLPTRLYRVCKGAGHTCPANNCSSHWPARPGSWTLPSRLSPPTPSTVLQLRIHRRYQDPSKCGP